jgi:transporter family protein
MTPEWLIPAVGFVALEGLLGITTKLAQRSIGWQELLIWTAIAYAALAIAFLAVLGEEIPFGAGAAWAALSGILASAGILLFYAALERGDASRVVPVTAAYPMITAILAVIVLAEDISPLRALGTVMVVAGVAVLSSD